VFQSTWEVENLHRLVSEYFPVTGMLDDGGRPAFTVQLPPDSKARFLGLRRRLQATGLLPLLRRRVDGAILAFMPQPPRGRWRWQINLLLFVLTIGTTFLAGYGMGSIPGAPGPAPDAVASGIAFSTSLLLILVVHEMGHKLVSMAHRIDASLPYFLPMTPPIGTMGAIIVTREPAPNRDALLDLGASGPIAGFLVALGVIILGLSRSFVLDPSAVHNQLLVNYPDPLLVQWLTRLVVRPQDGQLILMHPILFAGWIGLLVTSINLLPASMLDGGHVVRAIFGARRHRLISFAAVAAALALRYWLMAVLLLVFLLRLRRDHPGPLDDVSPLSRSRLLVALILLGIFVVSVVPVDVTPVRF